MRTAARRAKKSAQPARQRAAPGSRALLSVAARRHPFVAEVARQLEGCGVIAPSCAGAPTMTRLVVAVSGGADSVALLLACSVIAARRSRGASRLAPLAVHVHHHLRPTADDDAAFVQALCGRLKVEWRVMHVHPGRRNGNVSANARDLRYAALRHVAADVGAKFVAVAHHADDQFETMLIALCRGAGLDGLAGMPRQRMLDEQIALIRPLLNVRRAECEQFCRAAKIKWRDDPSNTDLTKVRARLRCDVLPVLEALWPDAPRRAAHAAEVAQACRAMLEGELQNRFGPASNQRWERRGLQALPRALLASGLRRAALHAAPGSADELGHRQLDAAADAIRSTNRAPKSFDWPGGLRLTVKSADVELHKAPRR